jgi:glutamate-1-semialdehyde 2,1-aminomutase
MLLPEELRNYRDWLRIDQALWSQYWFGMVNRGVIPQPFWRDEQWTVSVQHTDVDIDKHLAAFEDVAPGLAKVQKERRSAFVNAGR